MKKQLLINRRKFLNYMGKLALTFPLGCHNAVSSTNASKPKALTFAQISDTHIGYPSVTEKLLQSIIQGINQNNPAFVIHTGDIAHHNQVLEWKKFNKIFQNLQIPLYAIPGNHDTENIPTNKLKLLWQEHIGALQFSFIHTNIAFIGVDLTPFWLKDLDREQQQLNTRKKTLVWLATQLKNAKNCQNRLVFGHFPISLTSMRDFDYKNSISEPNVREEIANVLIQGNCNTYLCGHTHFGWENTLNMGFQKIRQIATTSLSYPCLIRGWTNHTSLKEKNHIGWYLWKLENSCLTYRFMQIPIETKTIFFNRY